MNEILVNALKEMIEAARECNRAAGHTVFNPAALEVAQEALSLAPAEQGDIGTQSHIGPSRQRAGRGSLCRSIDLQPSSYIHSWEGGDR